MRARQTVVAAVTLAILGTAACSAGAPAPTASPAPATDAAPVTLRAGLLTGAALLPKGFKLNTEAVNATTTGAPHGSASTVPITEMPCHELSVESFMTRHAPPAEDVAVGLEGPSADDVWEGQEALDRYAPGQAAAVMAAVRGAAVRCASYPGTLAGGTPTQNTVSVTAADVPADESLVLRIASTTPDDSEPYVSETALVREGDVILSVQKIVAQKPASGVDAVLPAAVAAYRAAAKG